MKIYLSGKITGLSNFKELFAVAEQELINQGHEVVNPVNLPHDHGKRWHSYMKECLRSMLDCDSIYMLSNWMHSEGAIIERAVAESLKFKVMYQDYELEPETVFEQFDDESLF